MNLILRKATIVDPQSPFHNQTVDVKITNNSFEKIGASLPKSDAHQEFELEGLHISQGWFDTSVSNPLAMVSLSSKPGSPKETLVSNQLLSYHR